MKGGKTMATRRSPGEGSLSRRPDGRWVGQLVVGHTVRGTPRRRTVYGRTKGEALRRLQVAQREAGLDPVDRRATLAQVVETWLAIRKPRLRVTTLDSYQRVLSKHSGELWRLPIARITTTAIESHLARMRDAKAGGRIVEYYRRLLRSVFRYAVRRGVVQVSPADNVESAPHRRKVPSPWEPGEVKAFLKAALGNRLYPLFHAALSTGLRVGELLGLQWADLDLVEGTLTVRHSRTRNPSGHALTEPKTPRSRRTIALDAETVAVLAARQRQRDEERTLATECDLWKGGDYVFSAKDGRPISHGWIGAELDRLAALAGVRKIRVHDLRHTYATLALRAGLQAHVVSERLGHAKVSTTLDIYAGVLQEQRVGAALSLEALLGQDAAPMQHSGKTN